MLRGLTTITYAVDYVPAARDWYAEVLGIEAYFAKEHEGALAYVEFRVGDHQAELGLLDRRHVPDGGPGTAVTYWAVDDVEAAHARLLALGATEHLPLTEQGPGFVTASVLDPFGNVLGVMYNEHYLAMVGAR
ncbi:VOC family protein [Nocardioides nanhaiensis]|uniref:VOC family protein n=1 Tax=Nocardioides nanhaiensis TaxID=1476871 RepID=A0ABP8VZG1_9ACTN